MLFIVFNVGKIVLFKNYKNLLLNNFILQKWLVQQIIDGGKFPAWLSFQTFGIKWRIHIFTVAFLLFLARSKFIYPSGALINLTLSKITYYPYMRNLQLGILPLTQFPYQINWGLYFKYLMIVSLNTIPFTCLQLGFTFDIQTKKL